MPADSYEPRRALGGDQDRPFALVWGSIAVSLRRAALMAAAVVVLTVPSAVAAADLQGVWLIDDDAAVQMFDCNGQICGRIRWLQKAQDTPHQLVRDERNPDPALQQRQLCGLTIITGLRAAGPDRWEGGSFYNPDDGKTYDVTAELRSADELSARIYAGTPILGETRTLIRVPRGTSEGWC